MVDKSRLKAKIAQKKLEIENKSRRVSIARDRLDALVNSKKQPNSYDIESRKNSIEAGVAKLREMLNKKKALVKELKKN